MGKYRKLFSNSILFSIGVLGSKLINIIMVPLYTYHLSTSEYGTVDIMITTMNLLVPIITLEMGQAAIRFATDKREIDERFDLYYNILRFCSFTSVLILALYPILRIFNIFENFLFLFTLLLLFAHINIILSQLVRGLGLVKQFAFNGILQTVVTVCSNFFFLVILDYKINGYLYSLILANLVSTIYLFLVSKGHKLFRRKNSPSNVLIKDMLRYSTPLIPNTTMWWLINGATRYFILFIIGSTANGIFAVASKIPSIISMIGSIFIQAWQLSVFEEYEKVDSEKFISIMFNLYYIVLFLAASGILIILIPTMNVVVSQAYFESWKLVPLLILGAIYQNLSGFLGVNYTASRRTKGAFTTSVYGGLAAILSNLIFLPIFGLFGASISSAVSFFLMWLIRLIDTRKYIETVINLKPFIFTNIIFLIQSLLLFHIDGIKLIIVESFCFLIMIIINLPYLNKAIKTVLSSK